MLRSLAHRVAALAPAVRLRAPVKDFVCSASSSGGQLPASFVAPTMVNMDDFPPPTRRLTKDDIVVQFVRSGGAGGQNVNKVNTKADIHFAVRRADFLPPWVKDNLVQQERNRMNSEGELVVNSSRHRTQKQNFEDALEKLQEMIDTAATPPTGPSQQTIAKVKVMAKRSNERRLEDKKRESSRKADRRSSRGDD